MSGNAQATVAPQPSTMLRITELSKYFGDSCAVDRISLEIEEGEFLTFLGSSGSGKSTTLYMIAGFEHPSAGNIELQGRSVLRVPPHRRNIGMVFQRYSLFPHMTVRENVGFPLSVRKLDPVQITSRVDELLNLVQLSEFGHRRPVQLSGGQQQRVALARGLAYEPELLLMDEPLAALDKRLREELQLQIRHLHERLRFTVIYVTHDQEEALRLSDRIAVFHKGRIVQVGTGVELYERPANAFVAAFIGNSNFLEASVEGVENGWMAVLTEAAGRYKACVPACDGIRAGDRVLLMIRPEKMQLVAADAGGNGMNAIPVRIRQEVFLGDNVTYDVISASGVELRVKQAEGPVALERLQPGGDAVLQWSPRDTHVFSEWSDEDIHFARTGGKDE